jgi:hypothetical protein
MHYSVTTFMLSGDWIVLTLYFGTLQAVMLVVLLAILARRSERRS